MPGFQMSQTDAQRIEAAIAGSSVVGVYSGHTHRNFRSSSPMAPGIPFVELAAVKEYPGGYGLVRVHEGGYAVNFYKTKGDASRAWSERSRGEYLGLYPYYVLGRHADRNFVVAADFSDAARSIPPSPPSPSPPAGSLPPTGMGAGAAVVGAAALGAGLAIRRAGSAARPRAC